MQRSTRIKLPALGLALVFAALLVASAASAKRPPQKAPRGATAPAKTTVVRVPKALAVLAPHKVFADCSSGAHTLSKFGDRVYPEMGNGGYTSLHSDVIINYDVPTNMFLPGTKVDLQVKSTQCLTDLSFDFERTNIRSATDGPNMTVNSVEINGVPASFTFKQPTYPGDPNGQDDPDPAAHAISNANPVSATNPNPPACSPQVSNTSQNGQQCPADKLVITPAVEIPSGTTFTVTINYTGRPGVHTDGDGSTEGWFRVNTTALPNDGAFVTTEPVGTDSWMPLNNHPSAKPSYDIIDTTNIGKTAIGPGSLVGTTPPTGDVTAFAPVNPTSVNPPDANFPAGSWTWHWHEGAGIANYLVENSIGSYDLTARTSPTSGIQYFQAVASGLTAARKTAIKASLDNQEDITEFQKQFNGPWPFTTDGVVVAQVSVGFAEEMQTKITFGNGITSTPSQGTFSHENMHQWFGDNVAEAAFNLTFWKEGFATLGEYLCTARRTPLACGVAGPDATPAAFDASLISRFNGTGNYNTTSSTFWTSAPSNPTVNNLFTTASTYTRPGTAYVAMWQILGRDTMIATMKQIQSQYGNSSITEAQLIDVFRQNLPVKSASCNARLTSFFTQWFDTAYPSGGGLNKPQLTGPGLNGPGFPCGRVTPASPDGANGWYKSPVTIAWSGFPTVQATQTATKNGCVDETVSTDGTYSPSCGVTVTTTATGAVVANSGLISEDFKIDQALPTTTATIVPASPDGLGNWYLSPPTVTLTPSDATSGLASTLYSLDGGPETQYTGPISPATEGFHTLSFHSTDNAGNVEPTQSLTWAVDLAPPVTTATLTPGIRNGWYANPELRLSVNDGNGSGNLAWLTGPCKPPYLCDYFTEISVDGGAFLEYEDPKHFETGNHFVQYRTTDAAGRVEATKLLAFKVDAQKPSVTLTAPAEGAVYPLDKLVTAKFKCVDRESGMDTCVGTVANGANLDTRSVGPHTFTVTGTDKAGNVTVVTHHYTVVYTWNGFFRPVTNTETSTLNLVHAGDLIKIGFGLNGDRGLNIFDPGFPSSSSIECPGWTPHSIPAAGAGSTAGLSYGVASGHYTYGWQTNTAWAGTCRRFTIELNDGTGPHTADFMFFA